MALVIDSSSPAVATNTGATVTNTSFTPPAGSILVIGWTGNTGTVNLTPQPSITDSLGAHLTYNLVGWNSRVDSPATNGQAAMWTANVVTSAAMTISVTNNDPSDPTDNSLDVWVVTGQDASPIGAFGKASSTSASSIAQSYTAQATSGQSFMVVCDWDAKGNQTAGSGCTMDATGTFPGIISYGYVNRTLDDDTNGSLNSINSNLPGTSTNLSWVYVEIKPLANNPTFEDPTPFINYFGVGRFAPNGRRHGWFGALDGGGDPQPLTTMVVKATETGSTNNGIALAVKVLLNAAIPPGGTTNSTTTITTPNLAITPSASGSLVYGALVSANGSTLWTPNGSTTSIQNVSDATNNSAYLNYKSTAITTAATPVTLGASAPTGITAGGLAEAEILAISTLIEDSSAPANVTSSAASTVTTAAFTPPNGSLVVAMVASDGGASVTTMAVTGGNSGTWTELVKANGTAKGYAGVWVYRVPGVAPQSITPVGIESQEASGIVNVAGSATLQTVNVVGITTQEVFGNESLTLTVSPVGIVSAETFGSVALSLGLFPQGIQSADQQGQHQVTPGSITLAPLGVESAQTFGNPAVVAGSANIAPIGIASQERTNSPSITSTVTVSPVGISTSEIFGSPNLASAVILAPTGIASSEQSGQQTLTPGSVTVSPLGVSTSEKFGVPNLVPGQVTLLPSSVLSSEYFGNSNLTLTIAPIGISSQEAFGKSTITTGSVTVTVTSVLSNEAFGIPTVLVGASLVNVVGIQSNEVFGNATVTTGQVTLSPTGIVTGEVFGNPTVNVGASFINGNGISSGEGFGNFTVSTTVSVVPIGIQSSQSFGNPTLTQFVTPTGVTSAEAFGTPTETVIAAVNPLGIVSNERFGNVTVVPGLVNVVLSGITTGEKFGNPTVSVGASFVSPVGIGSSEAFGKPTLTTGSVTVTPVGIKSGEASGILTISGQGLSQTIHIVSVISSEVFGRLNAARTPDIKVTYGLGIINVDVSSGHQNASVVPYHLIASTSGADVEASVGPLMVQ